MTIIEKPKYWKVRADEGRAIRPTGTVGPSTITSATCVKITCPTEADARARWEDCDYGIPDPSKGENTMAKDGETK